MDSVTTKNRQRSPGLIERAITSGYKRTLAPNPFKQVDFYLEGEGGDTQLPRLTPEDYWKPSQRFTGATREDCCWYRADVLDRLSHLSCPISEREP